VHLVPKKHLKEAAETYKDAAEEIKAWPAIVKGAQWHNFPEVSNVKYFPNSDAEYQRKVMPTSNSPIPIKKIGVRFHKIVACGSKMTCRRPGLFQMPRAAQ
jgi:mRNA-degrading endonuclease HigB of HigAB toxin-antitoxin module